MFVHSGLSSATENKYDLLTLLNNLKQSKWQILIPTPK